MACQRCQSDRVLDVSAKCSDLFSASTPSSEYDGYVPAHIGLGKGGDMIHLAYCLDCGQIQGTFPIAKDEIELHEDWKHCTEDT